MLVWLTQGKKMPRPSLVTFIVGGAIAVFPASPAEAQLVRSAPPPGVHQYSVRGFLNGDEMTPWESELSVADTTLGADAAVRTMYESRRRGDVFLFTYVAIWKRNDASSTRMIWLNNGGLPSTCTLERAGDQIVGKVNDGPVSAPIVAPGDVVPDFAVGAYLATRTLAAADTLRVNVVRCLPNSRRVQLVEVNDVRLSVRADSTRRGVGVPEPAWLVEGPASYPIKIWVAKSDHQVLRLEMPRGSVGYTVDEYRHTR